MAVSKPGNGAGFQPFSLLLFHSWGFAPGWYNIAPSALKLLKIIKLVAPKARPSSPW
jgi:hypothetical protein